MTKRIGIAAGNFRIDSGTRYCPKAKKRKKVGICNAATARHRMVEREGHSMDDIITGLMGEGGGRQSREYQELIDNIKSGRGQHHKNGSLAAAARERMIARETERYPDRGRDKANRKAYPREVAK